MFKNLDCLTTAVQLKETTTISSLNKEIVIKTQIIKALYSILLIFKFDLLYTASIISSTYVQCSHHCTNMTDYIDKEVVIIVEAKLSSNN